MAFRINNQKLIEAMLYLYKKAGDKGISNYQMMSMIFAADKYHLNKYGVPITGDCYIATKHGPVPKRVSKLLEKDAEYLQHIDDEEYPFKSIEQINKQKI